MLLRVLPVLRGDAETLSGKPASDEANVSEPSTLSVTTTGIFRGRPRARLTGAYAGAGGGASSISL